MLEPRLVSLASILKKKTSFDIHPDVRNPKFKYYNPELASTEFSESDKNFLFVQLMQMIAYSNFEIDLNKKHEVKDFVFLKSADLGLFYIGFIYFNLDAEEEDISEIKVDIFMALKTVEELMAEENNIISLNENALKLAANYFIHG